MKQPAEILNILSKNELIDATESLVKYEGMDYREAIIYICEKRNIEPEDIAKLITGSLKEKLKAEAERHNYLPKSNTLF